MSEALYASCAEALSLCQSSKDNLSELLHPETGFAPRLRQICRARLSELEESGAAAGLVSRDEKEALKLESDTWGLLQALISLHKTAPPQYPDPRDILAENPYTPPAALAQSIMQASPLLSALVVVREWLHDTAPAPPSLPSGGTSGYWNFTRHEIVQNKRTGSNATGIVMELDPDAVNRDKVAKALAVEDANYDRGLIQALFAHVRAGQLDDAVDLCRKAHQPWRAASIRGALLFQWRALLNEPPDNETVESEDISGWRGNLRRRLWKATCARAALNFALSPAERALYAALSPSPQTATAVSVSCRTWSDHLWALVSVTCEERLNTGLESLASECFWEGGESIVGGPEGIATIPTQESVEGKPERDWEHETVVALEALMSVNVDEGPLADNPYHVTQLNIILNRTDALLTAYATGLQSHAYDLSSPQYPIMTRFFAHLCLFLQMIDANVPLLATQTILEAYLQVLEAAGQRNLIAMYAGALGDNAVDRYAMFLSTLELSVDQNERRLTLMRARDNGLDMHRVATVTAERSIEKAFSVLPPPRGPLPSIAGTQSPPSDAELLLVRSIEWSTFLDTTYDSALQQANVIIRYFLAQGRISVAKLVLDMLPPELASIPEPEQRATEYFNYRQFFTVWESLDRAAQCQALEMPQLNQERMAWLSDYEVLVKQAREQVLKLLVADWLITDVDKNDDDRRRLDFIRIRQIFIPELILRLHAILYMSRVKFPENLKHALFLANIVADSRYKLYEDFSGEGGRALGDYLIAVRQAILGGLEGGGSDPFRIINQ